MQRRSPGPAADGDLSLKTLDTLSLMERILFLRRVPLFASLPAADLKSVGAIMIERAYPADEVIASEGEPGDEMFIIAQGEIRVVAGPGQGAELARRRAGEYVGEMAIISQEPRMATLVAATDVRLLCIDQEHFEALLNERPQTALAVMRVLCERLKDKPAA